MIYRNGHHTNGNALPPLDSVLEGDAGEVLQSFPDHSIDLVFTSPPYDDNRKSTYKGPRFDEYVDWFMPIAEQIKRVLKPDGSFVLNIKERAANGERQTYVLELILALKKHEWVWVREMTQSFSGCLGTVLTFRA